MQAHAEMWLAEDAPPESGVRLLTPRSPKAPPQDEPESLWEIGAQVSLEVLDLVVALSPLQGAWFSVRTGHIGQIAARVLGWELEAAQPGAARKALAVRWPELVPGYAAMSRLVELMVDLFFR